MNSPKKYPRYIKKLFPDIVEVALSDNYRDIIYQRVKYKCSKSKQNKVYIAKYALECCKTVRKIYGKYD